MFVNGKNLAKLIEAQFPKELAESWDNVGFLVGSPNGRVEKVMMALELTPEVVEEAVEKNVDLICVHHPIIFKPMREITDETEVGQMIKTLMQHRMTVYAAHTNLDAGEGGTGAYFAEMLELERCEPLSVTSSTSYVKLVVFTPVDHTELIADVIGKAGGGEIGNYEACHFYSEGMGGFKPIEGAEPYVGKIDEMTRVKEHRLEMIVPKSQAKHVVTEMLKVHPYEMPAYDLIPLDNIIEQYGVGVVGYLDESQSFEDMVDNVKDLLDIEYVRAVKTTDHPIRKVAVCPGAGTEYILEAAAHGCDVFITGDLKYHEAQLARSLRLSVIDAGHYETERPFMVEWARILREACDHKGYEVKIIVSEVNANPVQFL